MFSPRLASTGTQAGGRGVYLKGGGRGFSWLPWWGGRERGAGASQNPYHLPWVTRYLLPQPGHVQRFCVIPYVRLSLHREKKESEGGHLKGLPNVKITQ